jgi:hypothetical protein
VNCFFRQFVVKRRGTKNGKQERESVLICAGFTDQSDAVEFCLTPSSKKKRRTPENQSQPPSQPGYSSCYRCDEAFTFEDWNHSGTCHHIT